MGSGVRRGLAASGGSAPPPNCILGQATGVGAWCHGAQLCVHQVRALSVQVGASVCECVGVSSSM